MADWGVEGISPLSPLSSTSIIAIPDGAATPPVDIVIVDPDDKELIEMIEESRTAG